LRFADRAKRQTIFLVFRLRLLPPRSPRGKGAAAVVLRTRKPTSEASNDKEEAHIPQQD
jgi:hypothetical protein